MATIGELTEAKTSRYVQAGQIKLHYNQAGEGDPPIICLHGGGPGATGWSNFNRNLPAFSARFRTILVDLPQYGKSDPVAINEPRLAYNARVLRDMLDALGISRATLVGNSMGGGSATKFAVDYPDRLHRLVLMGSSGHGESLFTPVPTEGIKLIQDYFRGPSKEKMQKLIETLVYDSSSVTEELVEERYQASLNPAHREARAKSSQRMEDLTPELPKIKARTLLIWGRDDRFVPLDSGLSFLRKIPDSMFVVFSRCGHWAQYEHADEFNRLVLDFVTH